MFIFSTENVSHYYFNNNLKCNITSLILMFQHHVVLEKNTKDITMLYLREF